MMERLLAKYDECYGIAARLPRGLSQTQVLEIIAVWRGRPLYEGTTFSNAIWHAYSTQSAEAGREYADRVLL